MDLCLQPYTGHSQRILNTSLVVDDIFLGDHMDNFAVHGDCNSACSINDAIYIIL